MLRLRRWAKKLGLVLLELVVVLTVVSVVYNVATRDRVKPASALYGGPFVNVDGKLVAYRRWGAHGTPVILLGGFIGAVLPAPIRTILRSRTNSWRSGSGRSRCREPSTRFVRC